jgi:hypothetical protein
MANSSTLRNSWSLARSLAGRRFNVAHETVTLPELVRVVAELAGLARLEAAGTAASVGGCQVAATAGPGSIAQLVRALVLQTRGHRFESCCSHQTPHHPA